MLDDHRGDALAAHDRGDGVHDLALVAGGHAAGRLVQEQQLRLQGIGERDIEQLAFALGEVAGIVAALCCKAELAEDRIGLIGDGMIEVGEPAQMRGLALAREDRQRHVVEGGEIVEDVDELEAAGNSGPDALRSRTDA